jgi:hypothetical protein
MARNYRLFFNVLKIDNYRQMNDENSKCLMKTFTRKGNKQKRKIAHFQSKNIHLHFTPKHIIVLLKNKLCINIHTFVHDTCDHIISKYFIETKN